jgi:hypothetical protein
LPQNLPYLVDVIRDSQDYKKAACNKGRYCRLIESMRVRPSDSKDIDDGEDWIGKWPKAWQAHRQFIFDSVG